jgi:DNA-binding CsgD family transcriptional regulator
MPIQLDAIERYVAVQPGRPASITVILLDYDSDHAPREPEVSASSGLTGSRAAGCGIDQANPAAPFRDRDSIDSGNYPVRRTGVPAVPPTPCGSTRWGPVMGDELKATPGTSGAAPEPVAARLTPRELQVLDLIVAGKRSRRIASELGVSERTIEVHRRNLKLKLRTTNVVELVKVAFAHGICRIERGDAVDGAPAGEGRDPRAARRSAEAHD